MTGQLTPAQARSKHRKAFDEFWKVYPKKVAPTEAERVFAEVCERGVEPATLIAKAEAYARTVDPRNLQYVPAPHAWLRQGRYDDEDLFSNQVEQERVWLRECWRRADVKAVEARFHLSFPKTYPPESMTDPAAIKLWHRGRAQEWIASVAQERMESADEQA